VRVMAMLRVACTREHGKRQNGKETCADLH
jgi:hypothetical protein